MSSANLEQLMSEVRALTSDEQRKVRELIDSLLEPRAATSGMVSPEDLLDQRLLETGVISEIPPPIKDFTPYENRRPVPVKGKPVSETIIEERR
ncbi:MAG TPA: hypothetical protein VJH03_10190 [Blastocatellia bacterium]|nr:hypothetical protein [Blastocatellia bacterium]